ncbi:uncharacterized protein MELLADRAFT_94827 [Melampsora larici-populina 98AG31]|uniref:Ran GTPase-activating protein 1 n=1 Tax=Melampsora larici-populina (strain 98AG31 / pathotype 3-4-7) TaxID=747676 RepID=F4S825_MELLP|nr:uncharacterized protein MELLADRAFT_94827 [Melampsora larici-populina 98AG31]EGF99227.1 hypothetical protein MELLADRAFT_94827 [Melampsora larici-populina 98AG31]
MSSSTFTLKGQSLKCDTAEEISVHLEALKSDDQVTKVVVGGNTFGIGACEELGNVLKEKERLVEADLADIFTGRLISEIPQALSSLCNSLLNLNNLTIIDLSDNAFGGRCVDSMVPFLSSHLPLEELRLANNGLGPAGATVIADALYELGLKARQANQPSRLRKIICGRNRCENGSAKSWGRVFEVHSELTEVRLFQNDFRNHGWDPLMSGLACCSKLEVLDMWDNTATEKGSRAVASALPQLKNLRELNLGDCLLRPRGGAMIARALKLGNNSKLELLKLSGSEIDEEVVGLLVDFVTGYGSKLKRVELNDNFGDAEAAEELTGVWGNMKKALDTWGNEAEMDELDAIIEADSDEEDGSEGEEDKEDDESEVASGVSQPAEATETEQETPASIPTEEQHEEAVAPQPEPQVSSSVIASGVAKPTEIEQKTAASIPVDEQHQEAVAPQPEPPAPAPQVSSSVTEPVPAPEQTIKAVPQESTSDAIPTEASTSKPTVEVAPSQPEVSKDENSSTLHDLLIQTMKALKLT